MPQSETKRPGPESEGPRDHRRQPRVHLRRPVRLYYARFQDFIEVVTENISESGMYIHGTGIQPVGVSFEFALLLTDGFSLIEGTAEVMWVSFDDNGTTNGMGVRFVELVGDSAQLVRRIVAENLGDGGAPFDLDRCRQGNRPRD